MHKSNKKLWLPTSPAILVGAAVGGGGGGGGTIFTASPALNGDDFNPAASFRVRCKTDGAAAAGTKVRVTIVPGSINSLAITHAYIGKWNGDTTNINATTGLIELLFGGVAGFAGKSTPQTSDFADYASTFTITPGTDWFLVTFITADLPTNQVSQRYNGAAVNAETWFAANTGDAAPQTVSGMTKIATTNYCVGSIETSS